MPQGYKLSEEIHSDPELPRHIDRSIPLSELGEKLCGVQLRNVGVTLEIDGAGAGEEFGDLDFTDGGIEGPVGFRFSRQAVKAMLNGGRAALVLDLKSAVEPAELSSASGSCMPKSRRTRARCVCATRRNAASCSASSCPGI